MNQVIDALSTCVRHVGSFEDAPDLEAVRSLPTCVLKVLKETFQHCKVGHIYQWLHWLHLHSQYRINLCACFVVRTVKWFTAVVCPWLPTSCRHSSRMPTPFTRLCWSCWTGCRLTPVPQETRCRTLYRVCVCVCVLLFFPTAEHFVVKFSHCFTPLIDVNCF